MDLSRQVAAHAVALYDTEELQRGMNLMETADRIAEEVGVWAERCGYTIDEVTHPLWKETDPTVTSRLAGGTTGLKQAGSRENSRGSALLFQHRPSCHDWRVRNSTQESATALQRRKQVIWSGMLRS
jgi:hypothetical protein